MDINDRDFFKEEFTRAEIEELLGGKPAAGMFNFRSPAFRKLVLERDALGDKELIDLMLGEPRLIRRPVVRIDGNVYFGADISVLEKLVD